MVVNVKGVENDRKMKGVTGGVNDYARIPRGVIGNDIIGYMRQDDIAERIASYRRHNGGQDPPIVAKNRDGPIERQKVGATGVDGKPISKPETLEATQKQDGTGNGQKVEYVIVSDVCV
jgi:hypothetical protein